MIKSVKTKLFLVFVSLMSITLSGGIIINMLFLEKYYIYKNKHSFIEVAESIEKEYKRDKRSIQSYISLIYKNDGIACYIIDEKFNVVHYSVSQKVMNESTKVNKEIQDLIVGNFKELDENYIYEKVNKSNEQIPKIILVKGLENNEIIVLTKPMKGIVESAKIANQFYLMVGIVIIAIGAVVIYVFSRKITEPIVKMSKVAENISNLNFENKVEVESKDEIGSLGESINNISKRLSISMKRLQHDIELRKELVRNMSHELKTPIGVIKGYAEGISYGVADDEEKLNKYCTVIAEECDRMDTLVKELLELSKLEEISYELNIENFNIEQLMSTIKNRFIPIMDENKINYKFIYDEKINIHADYYLIERAITNFVTNAIKYVDENRYIEIRAERVNDNIQFTVYNTGKGIDIAELSKIWNVFYKVERARSRKEAGHGVGLAIVKLIADLHSGKVWAENTEKGVNFILNI